VLAADGSADAAETATLRDRMRADRPAELPVFDMGPPLAELLARCQEETGLPAPQRPAWA
jgi:N-methylhydantoinase B